ncbi:MAG TPA: hypothetical protein VMZ22_12215 [Acidimicrobiales bacterium]|nr:hypothetical protein [Acidimicrobiales bacterium]
MITRAGRRLAKLRRTLSGDVESPTTAWCLPSVYAACVNAFPGVVYDIGVGGYAAMAAANKHNTVVAFEGPATRQFRSQRRGRVFVEPLLVSDRRGDHTVTLDFFDEERHPGRSTVLRVAADAKEADVLRGAVRILKTHRPLVFCDVTAGTDAAAIERLRRQIRYFDIRLDDGVVEVGNDVDVDPDAPHHLLVPNEKLDRVLELVRSVAIDVQWPVSQ